MALRYPQQYRYIDHIAARDFGSVVKAQSPEGEQVALKVADNQGNVHRRFEREIRAMNCAAGFNTMPILDYDDSYEWYAMPLASHTLAEHQTPVAQAREAQTVLAAIAESLRPLHQRGQVHRDLKPENILFLPDENGGRWVVADFGIVRNVPGLTTSALTVADTLTGTPIWAAPEQYHDAHSSTPATDVYSAGLLMGWLLTGKLPTPGKQYAGIGSLTSSILRATSNDPDRRFRSLDDFYAHFREHISPVKVALDELFSKGQYEAIHGYFLEHPARLRSLVTRMVRLNKSDASEWIKLDAFGLTETIKQICENLSDYFNDVGRDNVDKFLCWILTVCESLKQSNNLDDLAAVLAMQFATTEGLDQWTPRRAALDWIDRQPPAVEAIARKMIEETGTWDFFAIEARDRFSSRRQTSLVQDLAD